MRIRKHFVSVGGRRVHYLRAGTGPALVLLHASACSSKVMRPLIEAFATRFTALALDTPGFGLSEKLPLTSPSVEDFADGLAETLDALGIEHAAVYGRHTGASIAVEFAARHPARCAMVLTDGYPILSGDYDDERIAQYLQPIVPKWDGSHLVWLWFRYRDQHAFWPWNAQTLTSRADTDVPDLDFLHRGVVEFLEAGDAYRAGYAAPFRHDALGAFRRLKVPACFGTRPDDWLHRTAALYPQDTWHEVMPPDARQAAEKELALLLRHPAHGAPPPPPACEGIDYLDIGDASLLVRSREDAAGNGAPLLLLHQVPGTSALYETLIDSIAPERPVYAIDLPGHGESDPLPDNPQSVEAWGKGALRALDALGLEQAHLYGHNGGAGVAVEMARQSPDRIRSIVLDCPILLDEAERDRFATSYAPDIAPSWEGAHLLRAWHHLRDQELWWPWFDRRSVNNRMSEPQIEPAALTERVREVLKQPYSYRPAWKAVFDYPTAESLGELAVPAAIIGAANDIFAPLLDGISYSEVPNKADGRAGIIDALVKNDGLR